MTWYVVDGTDGSGKSSSAEVIRRELESEGRRVMVFTHPNSDSVFGRLMARFLCIDGKPAMVLMILFYILDVVRSLTIMKLKRREYDDFLFVRYIMAVSYLPEKLCKPAYRLFANVLSLPDVKIFIDVDPDVALERIRSRGSDVEVFENREKLAEVRRKMLSLTDGWEVVDNNGSVEDTRRQTVEALGRQRSVRE